MAVILLPLVAIPLALGEILAELAGFLRNRRQKSEHMRIRPQTRYYI